MKRSKLKIVVLFVVLFSFFGCSTEDEFMEEKLTQKKRIENNSAPIFESLTCREYKVFRVKYNLRIGVIDSESGNTNLFTPANFVYAVRADYRNSHGITLLSSNLGTESNIIYDYWLVSVLIYNDYCDNYVPYPDPEIEAEIESDTRVELY